MSSFSFSANDVFLLVRRGFVFRGHVTNGTARVGDRVRFETSQGLVTGEISLIEINRKPTNTTIEGREIGLLLVNFSHDHANRMLTLSPTEEEAAALPCPVEMLGVKPPVVLRA